MSFRQFRFKFHPCERTIPRARKLRFLPFQSFQKNNQNCRHSLLLELQRCLITFDTPAFVLDPQIRLRASLSPLLVQVGSWDFILGLPIPCSLSIPLATLNKLNEFDLQFLIASTTTDPLTAASTIDTIGVGITAAAGTKTCPPIALHQVFYTWLFISRLITVSSQKSGQFSRLLPSLDVGAISQAPSPE